MGRSLHNKIRLRRRLSLLNVEKLRATVLAAFASIGLIVLAVAAFK